MDTEKIRKLLHEIELCNQLRDEILSSSQPVELRFNMDGTVDVDDGNFTFEASLGAHIREEIAKYLADVVEGFKTQISREAAP